LNTAALAKAKPLQFVWNGSFCNSDNHGYFPYTFQLPAPAARIRATLSFKGQDNYLGLSLYEKGTFRAYGYTAEKDGETVVLAEIWANTITRAATAGPLCSGLWEADVTTNQVRHRCPFKLIVEVWLNPVPASAAPALPLRPEKLTNDPGWYRGDLHVHSTDSDGKKNVEELFAIAKAQELHFLAITDHNNTSLNP
jgi:hypothetical protein